jgi:hypothetical protein
MAQKRALLVFPDYSAHGLTQRQRHVMQQAGVLPTSLGQYSTSGAAADRDTLLRILGPGFSTTVLCGEVTKRDVMASLRNLLARDTSVAVLAFCGHGVFEHAAGYHGSLVCSFNQRVSAVAIDDVAAEQRFSGTFIRILNMCDASAEAVPSNAYVEPIGQAQRDGTKPRGQLAAFQSMVIAASAPFTMAYGNSTGSYLVKALGALFSKSPVVTYEQVAAMLHSARDVKLQGCSVSMTQGLCGVFGSPAFQVRKPFPMCDVDDDVEF